MITLSRRTISPKELRSLGWEKTGSRFDPGNSGRVYTHKDGWKISHCGHPTALWPYILLDPAGRMILTGAAFGNPPHYGTAWPTVASAVDFVAQSLDVVYCPDCGQLVPVQKALAHGHGLTLEVVR